VRALPITGSHLPQAGLERRPNGYARKLQVARRLRRETTLSLHWIAKQLRMGAAGSPANLVRHEERN
jgi:hypothetical protein